MTFESVLKYRSAIMAFATFWILGSHSLSFCSDQWTFLNYFRPLLAYGYGGVEIFLFLSGMGIALSLSKSPSFVVFFSRRVSRIFPAYWIILTFLYLFENGSVRNYMGECLSLCYWYPLIIGDIGGGNVTFWYVSAAFAFYLLSFPLFHMLKKYPLPFTALISIVGILLFYLGILWMNDTLGNIHLFLARIPIYFSGLFVGYKIKVLHFPSKILVLISLLAYLSLGMGSMLLGGRVFTLYGFNFALLFFVTPGLIVALTIAFRWMEQWKMGKLFNKLLQYIGTFSLELYFTHMLIINLICQNHMEMNFGIFLMLSIVSSVVLKKMASCFLIMVKSFLIE